MIGVLTARFLSPENRGHYALFFTLVGLATNTLSLGLAQANTYFLNREKQDIGTLFGNSAIFIVFLALLNACGLFFIHTIFDLNLAGIPGLLPWIILWVAIVMMLVETILSGLVYGSHLYKVQSASLIIQMLLLVAATLFILAFEDRMLLSLELRVTSMMVFSAGYLFALWWNIRPLTFRISVKIFTKQAIFGSRTWLQNLIGLLNYRGYLLLLAVLSGPETVAIFSISLLLVEAVRFVPETVATILLPKLVSLEQQSKSSEFTSRTLRIVLLMATLVAAVLFALTPWLLPFVFGQAYREGIPVARLLLIGSIGGVVYQVMTRYFTSEAKQVYSIIASATVLIIAGGLSLVLIPTYGAIGAALTFAISAYVSAAMMLFFFNKHSGIPIANTVFANKNDWILFAGYIRKVKF